MDLVLARTDKQSMAELCFGEEVCNLQVGLKIRFRYENSEKSWIGIRMYLEF
ncbi:hypothetical protein GBA52_005113 [Prunus armeniaca]|nr:hypothetical protein GBA52_005113 [Prunus armeniaca]